ncbi:ATP-binding protein [Cellulomonas soli]
MGEVRDLRSAGSLRRAVLVEDALVLRPERSAPRTARHWVMRVVAGAGVGGAANQVVELLAGEVVANAVVHGPENGEVRVHVAVDPRRIRVAVSDDGGGVPVVGHPAPTAPSGRGLALVEALAETWGTVPRQGGGKTVWFEVDPEA